MTKETYIDKLFQNLETALAEELKARSKTRRIILELRKTINKEGSYTL